MPTTVCSTMFTHYSGMDKGNCDQLHYEIEVHMFISNFNYYIIVYADYLFLGF